MPKLLYNTPDMKIDEFKYNLPKELIAQFPPKERGTSNLLVLGRKNGKLEDRKYYNIPEYIKKEDIVVLNETRVLNSRTYFLTPKGRRVEVLFLEELSEGEWYVLIGRARNVKFGDILVNEEPNKEGGSIKILVKKRKENGFVVAFQEGDPYELFEKYGHTPLPPYINREDTESDEERYNTVFSNVPGAVAAPTASLNLTEEIIREIKTRGAKIVKVDLRVGWGTFAPIREENIEEHRIHKEQIKVSEETASAINKTILNGGKVWAFGTTVARTLESIAYKEREKGKYLVKSYIGYTDLYIYPGYEWKIVDTLVTNFHMPNSSLILLASSFAGKENIKKAYRHAIENKYKFLSYGDSMLIGDNLIEE
jgi:S-adenosylmethionine:tRNA ribosyltransferase-isomerase